MRVLPLLERQDRCLQIQRLLRQMLVVKLEERLQRRFQVVRAVETMRAKHLLQPPVEAIHHSGLRVLRLRESVLDAQRLAQRIEHVLATGVLLPAPKGPVGELAPVVGQQRLDLERRSLVQRVE